MKNPPYRYMELDISFQPAQFEQLAKVAVPGGNNRKLFFGHKIARMEYVVLHVVPGAAEVQFFYRKQLPNGQLSARRSKGIYQLDDDHPAMRGAWIMSLFGEKIDDHVMTAILCVWETPPELCNPLTHLMLET